MITKFLAPLTVVICISFISCQKNSDQQNSTDELNAKKENLEKSLNRIKSNLDERINDLSEESKEVGEDARLQITTAVNKLKEEREKVINQLDEVNEASGERLNQLEKDVESTQKDLVDRFQKISEDSKKWFEDQVKDQS